MKYRITRKVIFARGAETWLVEADSPEQAIAEFNEGLGEFEDENLSDRNFEEVELKHVELVKPKKAP